MYFYFSRLVSFITTWARVKVTGRDPDNQLDCAMDEARGVFLSTREPEGERLSGFSCVSLFLELYLDMYGCMCGVVYR